MEAFGHHWHLSVKFGCDTAAVERTIAEVKDDQAHRCDGTLPGLRALVRGTSHDGSSVRRPNGSFYHCR